MKASVLGKKALLLTGKRAKLDFVWHGSMQDPFLGVVLTIPCMEPSQAEIRCDMTIGNRAKETECSVAGESSRENTTEISGIQGDLHGDLCAMRDPYIMMGMFSGR